MADLHRPPPRSAADLLGAAQRDTPGAHALAALLPQAARIERPLLRALRLQERLRAADEAELWSSPLVELRGADGLLLRADVAELLRQRARVALQQGGEGARRLRLAQVLLQQHHAGAPPLVQLEEEVAWMAMASADPATDIDERLKVALAALVRDGRIGVARWAARAVPRLPAVAKSTPAAWLLSMAAADRVPTAARALGVPVPPGLGALDLAALAPHLGLAPLGVRRIGDRLELGAVGAGGVAIEVPASQPRFVRVSYGAAGSSEAAVPAGALQTLDVGWFDTVSLHSVDGRAWSVPVLSEDEQTALDGVSVRVAVARDPDTHRVGTVLDRTTLLVGPPLLDDPELIAWSAGGVPLPLALVRHAAVPAPLVLARSPRLDVVPLPLAGAVAEGSRVVSRGIDGDGKVHPVVGTWHQDEAGQATVATRTQAPLEGCVGAPVICEGHLVGVVTQVGRRSKSSTDPFPEPDADADAHPELYLQVAQVSPELMRPEADSPNIASTGPVDVELLPAAQGQAVLLSWGPPQDRHHLLFDGGPRATAARIVARIRQATGGRLDLVVVSHADADRVEGVTALLEAGIEVRDVWFNGPAQLPGAQADLRAPTVAVERLLQRLREHEVPVNRAFPDGAAMVLADAKLPRVLLPGGAGITLAGPPPERLAALATQWQRSAKRRASPAPDAPPQLPDAPAAEGTAPRTDPSETGGSRPAGSRGADNDTAQAARPLGGDRGINNGASIVLLFEHAGQRVLLPGDSWADPLIDAVRRLAGERDRRVLFVDLFVLPHGGSRGNVKPALFDVLEPGSIAICTDGSRYGHPDLETMELLAERAHGAAMVFNHRSDPLRAWADLRFQGMPLRTRFPDNDEGIVISLQPASSPVA